MDIAEKNNRKCKFCEVDPLKRGKIGVWLTPRELETIQNALYHWSSEVLRENNHVMKLHEDLKEISLSSDNQQEDDNGQGSNAAQEQDR